MTSPATAITASNNASKSEWSSAADGDGGVGTSHWDSTSGRESDETFHSEKNDGGDDDDDDDDDDDHDDFNSISHQMAGEGLEAPFQYNRHSLHKSKAAVARSANIPGYDQYSPSQCTVDYIDPLITTEEMLWARPNIGEFVEATLDRMGRAFAYNSVYVLKVVMDLQLTYRNITKSLKAQFPESAFLSLELVLRTATVLSHRLTRKQTDNASLSRELQLRTLISTLTLIITDTKASPRMLPCETYAQLLRDISESDADNQALYAEDGDNAIKLGDNEYLTRYACDLVRSLPVDMPPPSPDVNQEVIHFLFATGFINQLEERPSRRTINEILSRIRAEPSYWHSTFQIMYDDAASAIRLGRQLKFKKPTQMSQFARVWAEEVAKDIITNLETEFDRYQQFDPITAERAMIEGEEAWDSVPSARDDQIFIFGMLDLLAQLVLAFSILKDTVDRVVAFAEKVIEVSRKQAFRSKAMELILCSTAGAGENEYYETMRRLDRTIEVIANPHNGLGNQIPEEKYRIIQLVEQLKQEKREAMDRYEKKSVLHTGAMESIQRRMYSEPTPEGYMRTLDYFQRQDLQFNTQAREENRGTSVGRISGVPTLSSTATSSQDPRDDQTETLSSAEAGTMDSMAVFVSSPADTASCSCLSPTDTPCDTCTCRSLSTRDPMSPIDPALMLHTPNTPFEKLGTLPTSPQSAMLPIMYEESVPSTPTDSQLGPDSTLSKARRLSLELPIPVITPGSDEASDIHAQNDSSSPAKDEKGSDSVLTTPTSTYPEPSRTRPASAISLPVSTGSRRRRSIRDSFSDLIPVWSKKSLQLHKPLPPAPTPEFEHRSVPGSKAVLEIPPQREHTLLESRNHETNLEDISEEKEVVPPPRLEPYGPGRSQSSPNLRASPSVATMSSHHRKHSYTQGAPPVTQPGFTQLSTISDNPTEQGFVTTLYTGEPPKAVNYAYQPTEIAFSANVKHSCFTTAISPDGNYVAFLSPQSFQIWTIPPVDQPPPTKAAYIYNLGEFEGLKKSKMKSEYKGIALSEQYLVAMTKEKVYVHDLYDDNRVIHHELIKGWNFSAVAINGSLLVVGLSKFVDKTEQTGKIQIFRMNPPNLSGSSTVPRYELIGKDLDLPFKSGTPHDAPHVISLTRCGRYLSCGTPKHGYYFTWDLWQPEPRILANRQLRFFEGPNAEVITNISLFPDAKHLFVSTFPAVSTIAAKEKSNGSYIESLIYGIHGPNQRSTGQVSPRINASAMSPSGDALAFLSYNGTIWTTPVTRYEHDDNLTCFKSNKSSHKLGTQNDSPDITPFGKVNFSNDGTRVIAADKKGKILMLIFPLKAQEESRYAPSMYSALGTMATTTGVQRQLSSATFMSNPGTMISGRPYYAGTQSYNVSMTSFHAPTNVSTVSLMSPMSGNPEFGGFF
ncbi:hypothetical protein EX30DRAFT_374885 [Ascodesmis nigricans]|uniref:Uncharacterized protein n=1 Tax=Ascodesmis nigricans TaxID=341454 RepID=A0A4S2MR12_9PEZI|nr:hypothetical protein EX30DRAFT_374885 [Ascodesmis nigricans]